jgi:hypothetical protein
VSDLLSNLKSRLSKAAFSNGSPTISPSTVTNEWHPDRTNRAGNLALVISLIVYIF